MEQNLKGEGEEEAEISHLRAACVLGGGPLRSQPWLRCCCSQIPKSPRRTLPTGTAPIAHFLPSDGPRASPPGVLGAQFRAQPGPDRRCTSDGANAPGLGFSTWCCTQSLLQLRTPFQLTSALSDRVELPPTHPALPLLTPRRLPRARPCHGLSLPLSVSLSAARSPH
nr:uncharacterized protein LOC112282655 [Physcomitrium patens]|eukprot:XP_024376334.1 uncharacterized protein LOC112282655 [Physcomitrella patens]